MTAPRWTRNPGKRPRTGDQLLKIRWANGDEAKYEYTAGQLRFTKTGHPFDVEWVAKA